MRKQNNAGAIASNAGDDFHLIWTVKKLLEILNPNSELTAVTVEGPQSDDAKSIDDQGELYSIDIAEYYGGENFMDAKHVVFSQLKYSTYQSQKLWTVSNLCSTTARKGNNSIIRRLADTFKGFNERYGKETSDKLSLKLVSNRKVQDTLLNHIHDFLNLLRDENCNNIEDLLNCLSDECRKDIGKLNIASNLSLHDFIDFLSILNFDDCGTEIRSIQKAELISQLGKWNIHANNKYDLLIKNVREMMLPESSQGYAMNREYVLAALETCDEEMFPAPNKIKPLNNEYIERDSLSEFLDCFKQNQKHIICIEATAGIGKTTFVTHIKEKLPEESVLILYDCYGAGSYYEPRDRRHLIDVAIPQICNILAVECGTDWLIGDVKKKYEYWRQLNNRLESAINYIKKQNSKAILGIVIDAADNSMLASKMFKEECFLKELLEQRFPEGVYLIVTTRKERRESIPLTEDAIIIDLPAFTLNESSRNMRYKFPNANNEQCEKFHLITNGVPRLQSYLLEDDGSLDDLLKHNKVSMNSIFEDFIKTVNIEYGKIIDINIFFSTLINLIRPIPIKVFCEMLSLNEDTLSSISVECHSGFYINEKNILLNDEDFETYIRSNFQNNNEAFHIIADYMYNNRKDSFYCAKYLDFFLDKANFYEKINEIAFEKTDDYDINLILMDQIMKQRIKTALNRNEMRTPQNYLSSCKLVYNLINLNAKEESLYELSQNSPDEFALYYDEISIFNIFLTKNTDYKSLSNSALAFSHFPFYHDKANQYLESFIAFLNNDKKKEEKRRGNFPNIDEIINIIEAALRLNKINIVKELIESELRRDKLIYKMFYKFINYDYDNFCTILLTFDWTIADKLNIVCSYINLKKDPPNNVVDELLNEFENIELNDFFNEHLLTFIEYELSIKNDRFVNDAMNKLNMNTMFSELPYLFNNDEKYMFLNKLRYFALKNITDNKFKIEDLNIEIKNVNDRKKLNQIIDYLFPIFLFRIKCITNDNDLYDLAIKLLPQIDNPKISTNDYERNKINEEAILIFIESISYAKFDRKVYGELIKGLNIRNNIALKIQLLDRLGTKKETYNIQLKILKEIDDFFVNNPFSAKDMYEGYLNCAQIGRKINEEVGKQYFEKAINSTKGIDYESYRKILLFRCLADRLRLNNYTSPQLSFNIIRLSEDFFSKMGDVKNFPYQEAIETAAILSPKSIWGSLCRLDDRDDYNGFSIDDTLFIVINILLDMDKIFIRDAVALMSLFLPDQPFQYNKVMNKILKKISQLTVVEQKPLLEILINDILYKIPYSEKYDHCKQMNDYLKNKGITNISDYNELEKIESFLQDFYCDNRCSFDSKVNKDIQKDEIYKLSKDISSLEELHNKISSLSHKDVLIAIKEWLNEIDLNQYIDCLTWILEDISINYYHYHVDEILSVIESFIEENCNWPFIETWRNDENNQKYLIGLFIGEILYFSIKNENIFKTLLKIFPANNQVKFQIFLDYIVNNINLDDEKLIMMICKMSMSLTDNEVISFLEWTTENEMKKIHPSSGDTIQYSKDILEKVNEQCEIECFIWRLLGHKNKSIRWQAAHSLLRYSKLEEWNRIIHISNLYIGKLPNSFIDENNYFYIESSRTMYLITCLRILKEIQRPFKSIYQFFKFIACDSNTVHALQRRLAINICKILAPFCDEVSIKQISESDRCIAEKTVMSLNKMERSNNREQNQRIFRFDTMDTLLYLYDQVAIMFGCTQNDVANDCDYFISQFKINNKMCTDWINRFYTMNELIEKLDEYAELNSMFYVLDQYRCTKNQAILDYISYNSLLNSYLPGIENFWRFEFKNYIPLIPSLWNFDNLKKNINILEDITQLVANTIDITLYMLYHARNNYEDRTIQVESILVDNQILIDLFNELEKSDDKLYKYANNDKYECFIHPTYEIIGNFSENALDKNDMLQGDYSGLIGLSEYLAKYFNISKLDQLKNMRVESRQNTPIQYYNWNDKQGDYTHSYCMGQMLSIKKEVLLELLKEKNQSILIQLRISNGGEEMINNIYMLDSDKCEISLLRNECTHK